MSTFTLSYQPFLDSYNKCYKNIVTTNIMPQGPLRKLVRQVKMLPLSQFQTPGPCSPIQNCGLAIVSLGINNNYYTSPSGCGKYGSSCGLMSPDEIPDLLSFLLGNGYQFETQITNMLNQSGTTMTNKNIIGIVTYYGPKAPNIVYMR